MFEVLNIQPSEIVMFVLVLIRLSTFIVTMPIIGAENVAPQIKILLSLMFAIVVFPVVKVTDYDPKLIEQSVIWLALRESVIGIILGFVSRIFFFALSVSGELISLSVGLSAEQLLNPATGGRSTALQQFQIIIGSLLFLSLNAHHMLIAGAVESFNAVPIAIEGINLLGAKTMSAIATEVLVAGLKMSAPVMAAVFLMNIVMGIMGRAVPQINVLITSLPVNALMGFTMVGASLPLLVVVMDGLNESTVAMLFKVMKEL